MRRVAACLLVALGLHLNRKHQPGQTNNILMSGHDDHHREDPFKGSPSKFSENPFWDPLASIKCQAVFCH